MAICTAVSKISDLKQSVSFYKSQNKIYWISDYISSIRICISFEFYRFIQVILIQLAMWYTTSIITINSQWHKHVGLLTWISVICIHNYIQLALFGLFSLLGEHPQFKWCSPEASYGWCNKTLYQKSSQCIETLDLDTLAPGNKNIKRHRAHTIASDQSYDFISFCEIILEKVVCKSVSKHCKTLEISSSVHYYMDIPCVLRVVKCRLGCDGTSHSNYKKWVSIFLSRSLWLLICSGLEWNTPPHLPTKYWKQK